MGVYISGLEIPPKGKGAVVILCSSGAVYSGGQKVGTAVPVPPHGRLIDADALKISTAVPLNWKPYRYAHIDNIEAAPTIIPASEEGE